MIHWLATILLGPLLLLQGRAVRRRIPEMAEPPGERAGTCGEGAPLSLLILGDSAAAGVGAEHQQAALSGQLLTAIEDKYAVSWKLLAETGATTESTLLSVAELDNQQFDVIVVSLGVNDVTKRVGLKRWLQQQAELRTILKETIGAKLIVSSGIPPMDKFPALPQPLRWYLGHRAKQFDAALERELRLQEQCHFLSVRFTDDVSMMAKDGFHPGSRLYKEWAARIEEIIAQWDQSHGSKEPI